MQKEREGGESKDTGQIFGRTKGQKNQPRCEKKAYFCHDTFTVGVKGLVMKTGG